MTIKSSPYVLEAKAVGRDYQQGDSLSAGAAGY